MKVTAIYKSKDTDKVVKSIEMDFPPEKQQEKKILKWLRFLKTSHDKENSTKMVVSIIH